MSPLLQEFYDEMYLAINGKQPTWFLHSVGLCLNLHIFLDSKNIAAHFMYMQELRMQFENVKMERYYPFNKDHKQFHNETDKYSNLKRVEWINNHSSRSIRPDPNKCCIDTPFECGQCAKDLIY